jgi:hypothetical protein
MSNSCINLMRSHWRRMEPHVAQVMRHTLDKPRRALGGPYLSMTPP